jgi:hypothetical protein
LPDVPTFAELLPGFRGISLEWIRCAQRQRTHAGFSLFHSIESLAPATSKSLGLRCDEVGDLGLAGQVEAENHLLLQTIGVRNALVLA